MILCLINVLILNIFDTSSTIPCRTIETVSFHEAGRMLSAPLKGKICDFFNFKYFYGNSINSYSSSSSFPANHLDLNPRKQAAFSQHSCLPSSAPRTVTLKFKINRFEIEAIRRTYLNSLNSSLGNSQTFIAVFRRSMTECRKFPINCFDFVLH